MQTQRLHLHKCAHCGEARKLPYGADVNSFCSKCGRMTWHELQTTHEVAGNIEERIERFLQNIQWRVKPDDAPEEKLTLKAVSETLLKAGYPDRNVSRLTETRGHALTASTRIHGSRKPDAHYVLWGGNGTGKTQIGTRVAALRAWEKKGAGLYVSVPRLLQQMKSCLDKKQPVDDLIRPLRTTAFLVVDEAQELVASPDWLMPALRDVGSVRYDTFRPMIWLMNCAKREDVHDALGARIVDRANETGGLLHCDWPSYRAA